jgi:vanillate O-demethylase ferredoxin subunit
MLQISEPRNNFRLNEDAEHSVFIAGGIGITPLLCMVRRFEHLGRSWELHYASRSRSAAAFLKTLESLDANRARIHLTFDAESNGRMLRTYP